MFMLNCVKKSAVFSCFVIFTASFLSISTTAKTWQVSTQKEFKKAEQSVVAGDTIVLANGVWQDFEILFTAQGTAEQPITLTAETKGKVIISGQSDLRLAGEHLIVSGLVFKDGYSPRGEVISFRQNSSNFAYHSRVTEVVIDHFNNPNKFEQDKWVVMYGKHNRFDHSHLVGKSNAGVTMAVRLNSKESIENHHRIDHNYFGPRPVLGSNGGETLRIGTSHHSLNDSFTIIENNYFDRCNGEVEIISNKSGSNAIRNNTFFESRGTLTLRHGNGNVVENNVFFGNGVDHTGGIRVINADQVIRNNYMEGLTGYRFGSGFTVMNGVPNSSINRYHQVKNALIENNTLVNVDNIQLAAGSDTERSATPIDSRFYNNLVSHEKGRDPFTVFDDISGIKFKGNIYNNIANAQLNKGFESLTVTMKRHSNGLLYPVDKKLQNKGVSKDLVVTQKADVGVSWYAKAEPSIAFASGKIISVSPAEGAIFEAIALAENGDVIELTEGEYTLNKIIKVNKVITVKAAKQAKVTLNVTRSTTFEILDNGSLQLDGLNIDASKAADSAGNVFVRTSRLPMLTTFRLELLNSQISNFNINHSFHFFDAGSRSLAFEILLKNSSFKNMTGDVLRLNKETDDLGIYNAEYVTIVNSEFNNIEGALIKLYRGGTDESTFGPHLLLANNQLNNVGLGRRNKEQAVAYIHGVQVTTVMGNTFKNTAPLLINHTVGEPITKVVDNQFIDTKEFKIEELNFPGPHTAEVKNNTFKVTTK
ncbi:polysaccharide lyase 6 family protein [Thalassotalea agariperforans]